MSPAVVLALKFGAISPKRNPISEFLDNKYRKVYQNSRIKFCKSSLQGASLGGRGNSSEILVETDWLKCTAVILKVWGEGISINPIRLKPLPTNLL
jgi:hypothetical protein